MRFEILSQLEQVSLQFGQQAGVQVRAASASHASQFLAFGALIKLTELLLDVGDCLVDVVKSGANSVHGQIKLLIVVVHIFLKVRD